MKKQLTIIVFGILILLLLQLPAWGMDSENPANLALPGTHFELVFSDASVQTGNNLINLNSINLDMTDPAVKEEFLSRMEAGYFKLNANVEEETSLTIGRVKLGIRPWAGGTACLAPGWTELLFKGYEPGKEYIIEGTTVNAISAASLDVSYGHPILLDEPYSLAIGGAFHYLLGLAMGGVEYTKGTFTSDQYAQLNYEMEGTSYTNVGGLIDNGFQPGDSSGYVFDLGMAYKTDRLTTGVVLKNIGPGIHWKNVFKWDIKTSGSLNGSPNGPVYSDDGTIDDIQESTDMTTKIPMVLGVTADYKLIPRHITAHLGFEKGFKDSYGISSTPRYSAGLDLETLRIIQLAGEIGLQGRQIDIHTSAELRLWILWIKTKLGWTGDFSPISNKTTGYSAAATVKIHF